MASMARAPKADARLCLGLGFFPEEARHGFLLNLPIGKDDTAPVMLSEHRVWNLTDGKVDIPDVSPADPGLRAIVERFRWDEIASVFWEEAAQRLRNAGIAVPRMPKKGRIPIHASLGKELCVLLWAIEDADSALIPEALRNWEGLAPEERWWLYTMTAAATGQAQQRGIGWRKALRFAMTENPLVKGDGIPPKARKEILRSSQMNLF
jgi:hypothetical protein